MGSSSFLSVHDVYRGYLAQGNQMACLCRRFYINILKIHDSSIFCNWNNPFPQVNLWLMGQSHFQCLCLNLPTLALCNSVFFCFSLPLSPTLYRCYINTGTYLSAMYLYFTYAISNFHPTLQDIISSPYHRSLNVFLCKLHTEKYKAMKKILMYPSSKMNKCYLLPFSLQNLLRMKMVQTELKSALNLTPQSYRGSHCPEIGMYLFCSYFF